MYEQNDVLKQEWDICRWTESTTKEGAIAQATAHISEKVLKNHQAGNRTLWKEQGINPRMQRMERHIFAELRQAAYGLI